MGCCNSVDDSRGNTPSSAASSSRRTRGARRSSILTTPKRRGEVTVPCQDDQMLGVAPGASMTQSQTGPTAESVNSITPAMYSTGYLAKEPAPELIRDRILAKAIKGTLEGAVDSDDDDDEGNDEDRKSSHQSSVSAASAVDLRAPAPLKTKDNKFVKAIPLPSVSDRSTREDARDVMWRSKQDSFSVASSAKSSKQLAYSRAPPLLGTIEEEEDFSVTDEKTLGKANTASWLETQVTMLNPEVAASVAARANASQPADHDTPADHSSTETGLTNSPGGVPNPMEKPSSPSPLPRQGSPIREAACIDVNLV